MAISITFFKGSYVIDSGGPILRYPAASTELTTGGNDVIISPVASDSRRSKVLRAHYTDFTSPTGGSAEEVASAIEELNTGVSVTVQNHVAIPIDDLFVEELSSFTLSVDTGVSTATTMVYTFDATSGHGIVAGNEITFLESGEGRSFHAKVISESSDVITIDRPIDYLFEAALTTCNITNSNMNVVGSLASPRIFSIIEGTHSSDLTRFMLTMTDASAMDDGKFGGIDALTNGLIFRYVGDFQKTVFNFKTNQDIKQFCFDVNYSDKAPAGEFGLAARLTFNGGDKHDTSLRLQGTDVVQWVVQDDLTGLLSIMVSAQGRKTTHL